MEEKMRLPEWFSGASDSSCPAGVRGGAPGFLERNLSSFSSVMLSLLSSEESASAPGLLQRLHASARLLGVLLLILASALSSSGSFLLIILVFTYSLSALSSVRPLRLFKRALPAFVFTLFLAFPAVFKTGDAPGGIFSLALGNLKITATWQGVGTYLFFLLRVTVMVSLASLLLLTTRQADFFRALRSFRLPSFFVTALFMTFRYIFILLKTAEDATLARKSRTVRKGPIRESERWFASRTAFLLKKSVSIAEEVHLAVLSRAFTGTFRSLRQGSIGGTDYAWLGVSFFFLLLSFGF